MTTVKPKTIKPKPVTTIDTYIRMLVFNPTQHVVWVCMEPYPVQNIIRRIPSCIGDVDYKLYHGPSPINEIPTGWYSEFLKYNLVKPDGTETLSLAPVPTEFVAPIRLVKAKCYALVGLWNLIKGQVEKLDLHNNPLVSEYVTIEEAAVIYADAFNINNDQALVLAQFKKDELQQRLKKIKLLELEIETKIVNFITEQQVMDYYKLQTIRLCSVQPLDLKWMLDPKL